MEHDVTKALTAPRVTLMDVNAAIIKETYTVLPNGRTTVCQLTLDNGFTVEGQSACVSLANYNAEVGNEIARENAVDKVWQMLGFRLADSMVGVTKLPVVEEQVSADVVGDVLHEELVLRDPVKIGDQVWFYERVGDQESAPMLALVAGIPKEGWVALTIFAPNGTVHARDTVVMLYPWMTTPDLPYYARLKFN